jgi:hypothetical protein
MATIAELTKTHRHDDDLTNIIGTVRSVAESRFDLVAAQSALSVVSGTAWIVDPTGEPQLSEFGVSEPTLTAQYTRSAERNIANRLGIPIKYLDRLNASTDADLRDLADHNVNQLAASDDRTALYRLLRADDGLLLRAVLSDRYQAFDNDLALRALLGGLQGANLGLDDCRVEGDYNDSRFRLRVTVPSVEHNIADVLKDYRMPFSMREDRRPHDRPEPGERPPVLHAGFEIGNDEGGGGSFYVKERAEIAVCRNGLTREVTFKKAHIGASLGAGEVEWSDDTRKNVYALLESQVKDVLVQCLTTDRLKGIADEMRVASGLEVASPTNAIEAVVKKFGLTEEERNDVFDCFTRGGEQTVLGVANAMTAAAQLSDDGERQGELETAFWRIVDAPGAYANA